MDYITRMLSNLPFALPDWLPSWAALALALPILLYLLAFLLMPFSVFGVKSRLESLEAQIDSLHEDLRMMAFRASGALPPSTTSFDAREEPPSFSRMKTAQRSYAEPVPAEPRRSPPAAAPARDPRYAAPPPRAGRRTEPRLD